MLKLDFETTLKKNLPHGVQQPRRAQVYVGFQCHQRCGFCYYKHRCQEPMFSLDFIKKQVDFLVAYGIREFEITGGEPSEHPQLKDICKCIKDTSPASKIAVITNGGLWKSDCWDHIDEVLLSYHLGRHASNYDASFFPLGSTYLKAAKTKDLAHKLGKLLRTNTVLGTFNLDALDSTLDDLASFQPAVVNFLPVNLFDQASGLASTIDYPQLRPKLKKSIDYLKSKLPDALVFVRYMPFCGMEGYEQHIVGHLQHIYDWFDWNVELSGVEHLAEIERDGGQRLLKQLSRYGSTSVKSALDARASLYQKPAKCLACRFNLICDGIEAQVDQDLAKAFAQPQLGSIVKNIIQFVGESSRIKHDCVYGRV